MDKFTINHSIALYQIVNYLLFENPGTKDAKEREMPFNVKMKLNRMGSFFEKDFVEYEKKREELVREFGEESGDKISVKEENMDEFKKKIAEVLSTETNPDIMKLTLEEANQIKVEGVSLAQMDLFMKYCVDDPKYAETAAAVTDLLKK